MVKEAIGQIKAGAEWVGEKVGEAWNLAQNKAKDISNHVKSSLVQIAGGSAPANPGPNKNSGRSFRDKLNDIKNNPGDWVKTKESNVESTKLGNRGGRSIEQEYTNKNTGEKIYRHILENESGGIIDDHYRPYPKQ